MTSPAGRDRAAVIDDAFSGMQRWGLRLVIIAASVFVVGWIVGELWVIIFPVIVALIVSTVLVPAVTWLRDRSVPSSLASAMVVVGFLAAVVGIVAALTPQVAGQAPELADSAARGLQKIRDWLTGGPLGLSEGQITRAIEAVQEKLRNSAAAISSGLFSTIGAATSAVINLVLILMLTFFFVKDGHQFLPWMKTLGGRRAGEHTAEVMNRAWDTLGGFIRTQSLVALIDAIIIGVALAILGVPLAVPLAVVTFFGGYIPIIGAFISGALAVLVTLVTNGGTDALIALGVVVAVQQLEGNVLSPYLQGKNLNLHAAVVLLAVTAGGTMFGITGAFLAVPVAATTAEVLRYVNERIDQAVSESAPPEDSESAQKLERQAED
jgi:predicted PurR-regulated permease PerM